MRTEVLTIYQKSLYLTVLNATMIARSLGQTIRQHDRARHIRMYKKRTFKELERLCYKMDHGTLRRGNILRSIEAIQTNLPISFGQAQKGLNVLLKCHYFLYHLHEPVGSELDCPLDSVVLKSLGENISLSHMSRDDYLRLQHEISRIAVPRIKYDRQWDERHLMDEGLI